MALKYCFELKSGDTNPGKPLKVTKICVPIPVKVDPWEPWWEDVVHRHLDPRPDPWVFDDQLDRIVMQDLTVLAAIDQLIDSLSSTARQTLKQQLATAITQLELPEGRRVDYS